MIVAALDPDAAEQLAGAFPPAAVLARQFHGQQHILLGGERGDQVVRLKNETDLAAAQQRHLIFGQPANVLAVEQNLSAGWRVEARHQSQQRALPAPRRTHDGGKLAGRDFQIDTFEDIDTMGAGVDGLGEIADLNQACIMAFRPGLTGEIRVGPENRGACPTGARHRNGETLHC